MGIKLRASAVCIVLALVQAGLAVPTSDFKELLADPRAFNGKRVTLIGVAEIGGDEFFLYPDEHARRVGDSGVFISSLNNVTFQRFNNYWLKVTGIVNANTHGPLGTDPCEVMLDRLEPLPLPPIADVNIYGIFRNDTTETVTLKVATPTGYSIFDLQPHSTTPPGVITRGNVEVSTPSGQLIARAKLVPSKLAAEFFDPVRRAYYYRIVDKKVELVSPHETKEWNISWPPGFGNFPNRK